MRDTLTWPETVDVGLRRLKFARDRREQVGSVVDDQDGATVEEIAEIMLVDEEKVEHDVQALKDRGKVYEMGGELQLA